MCGSGTFARARIPEPLEERGETVNTIELTDAEVLWLIGHTAYEGGIGRDIYDKVTRIPVKRPLAQLPLEVK